jgi:hypothetical protein
VVEPEHFYDRTSDATRFREAIRRFDELNSRDPNQEPDGERMAPRELINSQRVCAWVMRLDAAASEELRLAARCQHLCRWEIPRETYPATRAGYHQWKNELKRFHAARSAEVMRGVGYPEDIIGKVSDLNLKRNFPADPQVRTLEDALCLVFLEHQFGELAAKLDDEKTVNALKKSWEKMTDAARAHALALQYSAREMELVQRALAG